MLTIIKGFYLHYHILSQHCEVGTIIVLIFSSVETEALAVITAAYAIVL